MSDEEQKKREYTMSESALAQRREASKAGAEAATGPRTEEGKAASSRNAWKHGLYSQVNNQGLSWMELSAVKAFARPCTTTCRKYPCSLVDDGLTAPGGDCLDKTVYVGAFNGIIEALQQDGGRDNVNAMMASQMAGSIELLQQMRDEMGEQGLVIHQPMVNKQGEVVGHKAVLNPAMPPYIKLLDTLGLNLPELMMTPKAVEGAKRGEQEEDLMQRFIEGISRAGSGQRPPQVFDDAEYSEVGDGEAQE